MLRYAEAMTRTPVAVPDELFAALRARLEPRQMVELTSAIAWENYRARFDHAFGIESQEFSAGAVLSVAGGARSLMRARPGCATSPAAASRPSCSSSAPRAG